MIDHFNLPVSDFKKSLQLYRSMLRPLGYQPIFEDQDAVGFGISTWQFGIYPETGVINRLHVAFIAVDHQSVQAFHQAALNLGAQSNGLPSLRKHYGDNYFAAYILDFDGHNIEAVCRG